MNIFQNKKAVVGAAVILAITLIASVVASPANSGDSRFVIFLLISSSILFIGEDSCIKNKGEKAS
ncbi:MAG: hypothetical protein AAF902_24305 [Chloroflexota bacterium]